MDSSYNHYSDSFEDSCPEHVEMLCQNDWSKTLALLPELPASLLAPLSDSLFRDERFTHHLTTLRYLQRRIGGTSEKFFLEESLALKKVNNNPLRRTVAKKGLLAFPNSTELRLHYAEASLAVGHYDGLRPIADHLVKNVPKEASTWIVQAAVCHHEEKWEKAIEARKKLVEIWPDSIFAKAELVKELICAGSFEAAKSVLKLHRNEFVKQGSWDHFDAHLAKAQFKEKLKEELPSDPTDLLLLDRDLIDLLGRRSAYKEMLELVEEVEREHPNNPDVLFRKISALSLNSQVAQAKELACDMLARFPENRSRIIRQIALLEDLAGNWKIALALLESERDHVSTGVFHIHYLSQIYTRLHKFGKALEVLDAVPLESLRTVYQQHILEARATALIGCGSTSTAMAVLAELRERTGADTFEEWFHRAASWYELQRGNIDLAKNIYLRSRQANTSGANLPAEVPREIKSALSERAAVRQILLFSVVKNERSRMPEFLRHYRKLGVDVFYIIDSGSSDGTLEYLFEQPDVRLFQSSYSYAHSGFGLGWVQYLMTQYGGNQWCVHVDADELLVFPHSEEMKLQHLCEYMDENGYDILPAYMMDMFPRSLAESKKWDASTSMLDVSPYFDSNIRFVPKYAAPYISVNGGIRTRIMGDGTGPGVLLEKIPLLRADLNIDFTHGPHQVSPCIASDVTGTLLHFKIVGDFAAPVEDEIRSGEHWANALHYRAYKRWLEATDPHTDLRCEATKKYRSSRQLVDQGLMKTSVPFEQFIDERKTRFCQSNPKLVLLHLPGVDTSSLLSTLGMAGFDSIYRGHRQIHTPTGIAEDLCTFNVYSGFGVQQSFVELYHLLPHTRFIYCRLSLEEWMPIITDYCLTHFGALTPAEIRNIPLEQSNIDIDLLRGIKHLVSDWPSWEQVYASFDKFIMNGLSEFNEKRAAVLDPKQIEGNALKSLVGEELH